MGEVQDASNAVNSVTSGGEQSGFSRGSDTADDGGDSLILEIGEHYLVKRCDNTWRKTVFPTLLALKMRVIYTFIFR